MISYIVTILKCTLHLYHWAPWALGIKVIPTFPSSRSDACFFPMHIPPMPRFQTMVNGLLVSNLEFGQL